ncbi:hypothetical protein [Glycomyces arizonensis]|uniref:hypothetical protein n=1 Tax=Glycomyces arizonensis TaxID=256035 RepID=UPI00041468FE|nr:hypothetical protein [Glycomyces arizonensis]
MSAKFRHIGDTAKGAGGVQVIDDPSDQRWGSASTRDAYISGGPRDGDMVRLWSPKGRIPGKLYLAEDIWTRRGPLIKYHLDKEANRCDGSPGVMYTCADPAAEAARLHEESRRLRDRADEIDQAAARLIQP